MVMNMKNKIALLIALITIPVIGMEKPEQPKKERAIPSLKTMAIQQVLKNTASVEDFEKALENLPIELQCESVKEAIKVKKFLIDDFIQLGSVNQI